MRVWTAALGAALILAGCGSAEPPPPPEPTVDAGEAESASAAPDVSAETAPAADEAGVTAAAVTPIMEGAPAYAPLYPGAEVEQTTAAPAGEGGIVIYTTEASPETVVDFHKAQAEAAGLESTVSMSQGETRAYGASGAEGADTLSVVASPDGDATSVQVSWSEGE